MRKIGLVLVVLALAVGFGMPAEAGGKGAVAAGLYVGEYPNPEPGGGNSELVYPLVRVGNVVFNPRAGGEVKVQINLRKGQPETTFQVFLVHQSEWGSVAQQDLSMTTDKHGHATLRFVNTPDTTENPVFVKAIIRVNRYGPVYVTDELYLNLKK